MTYGIKIFGGVDNIQIDSDRSNIGIRIVDSGTSSTITGTVANIFFDKLIAINYIPSSGNQNPLFFNKATTPWTVVNFGGISTPVDWVILDTFPTTASTSGYGVQVFNADGDVCFDTEVLQNDGASFTDFALLGTFSGNPIEDLGPLTTDPTDYVIMNHSTWGSAGETIKIGYLFDNVPTNTLEGIYHYAYNVRYNPRNGLSTERYWTNFVNLFSFKIGSV